MSAEFGRFPFGRENTIRPARMAEGGEVDGRAGALVVGVYPSAWHVRWAAPSRLRERAKTSERGAGPSRDPAARKGVVGALAVDVEPTVFWDGTDDDFTKRVQDWKDQVGFVEGDGHGQHGHIGTKSPGSNGSSGAKLERHYLAPRGVSTAQSAFTDVYPVFVVKYGSAKKREQGDAVDVEYSAIATELGFDPADIPRRPKPRDLAAEAAAQFGDLLVAALEDSGARQVITLGDEAFQTLVSVPAAGARAPLLDDGARATGLASLYAEGLYGREGTVQVRGRAVPWVPLIHPGLLRPKRPARTLSVPLAGALADARDDTQAGPQTGGYDDVVVDPTRRTQDGWNALHERWASRAGRS